MDLFSNLCRLGSILVEITRDAHASGIKALQARAGYCRLLSAPTRDVFWVLGGGMTELFVAST
jgi:hypothetical protein